MNATIIHTGAELAAHIEREAAMLGVRSSQLMALVYPNPSATLNSIRNAKHPTRATVEKINGILLHKVVMPEATERADMSHARRLETIAARSELHYVRRDPCFRCGTRADVGCRHQGAENG